MFPVMLTEANFFSAVQVSSILDDAARRYTPPSDYPDSVIDRVLVLSSDRKKVEQDQIPEFFTPVTGKWGLKCMCS